MKLYRVAYIDKAGVLSAQWHGTLALARTHWAALEADMTQRPVDIETVEIPTRQAHALATWLNEHHTYRAESWV